MRNRTGRYVVFMVICLSVGMISSSRAHIQEKNDPNDANGPLDLKGATLSHPQGNIRSSLTTRGDWTAGTLDDGSALKFAYDSRGNGFGDFYVEVKAAPGGGLRGRLYRGSDALVGGGEFVTNVSASRNGHTLVVKFAKRRLDPRNNFIGWAAQSEYRGTMACAERKFGCFDVMPDGTFYQHNL